MNARRRLVLRIRDEHWLAAAGFLAIVCLFGCQPADGPNGDRTPQPGHTTTITCPPQCTPPPTNPTLHAAPATLPAGTHPAVPHNATGFCADSAYTTAHTAKGKAAQCAEHGGVAE